MTMCTMKYPDHEGRTRTRHVKDVSMAMHMMEAGLDKDDMELWDGSEKLCTVHPCSEGVWSVSK